MQSLKFDENGRSFKIFLQAYKSPKSKYMAKYPMREFLRYANLTNYDQIIQLEPNVLETTLENWIMDQAEKGIKGTTIRARLSIVSTFLDMNRVIYHKKLLSRLIPRDTEELGGSIAFTNEEIKLMLHKVNIRTEALIHFLASTGIRPGALVDPVLTIKHLIDMPNECKAIKVYDQTKEGYWAFLTPEASRALKHYFQSRKLNGEILTENSPIFANIYGEAYQNKQHLSDIGLRQILYRRLKASGIIRTKLRHRFDKAVIYGFRKRFNTILKINNEVNSNIAEKLMAHKRGLDGTYLTPTREECFAEFQKAIPDLTIDQTERLKIENEAKTKKINEYEVDRLRLDALESLVQNLKDQGTFWVFLEDIIEGTKPEDRVKKEKLFAYLQKMLDSEK